MSHLYCIPFSESDPETDILLGGKGASLANMTRAGLPVPPGFGITTEAFADFLNASMLRQTIIDKVKAINCTDIDHLDAGSAELRALILDNPMPAEVEESIRQAYAVLCALAGLPDELPVAVRSSATAEDLPDASFAGQQDTYLWVTGASEVLENVRKCWASLYTSRAINYRRNQNIPEEDLLMSVVVQKMVNARTAGVAMTLNPVNGDRSKIVIDASWGLGEAVVSGEVTPDNFLIDKVMMGVLKSDIQHKAIEHVPDREQRRVLCRAVPDERATQASLTEDEVKEVCQFAKIIEKHYGCPQDIEWALDADLPAGQNFMLLQSRPETVWANKKTESKTPVKTGMEGLLHTLMNPLAGKK